VIAYEDPVEVKVGRLSTLVVKRGEKVVTTGVVPRVVNMTTQDIEQTASVEARIEVSQLPPSYSQQARSEAFSKLKALHQNALANPETQPEQMNLRDELIRLGIPPANLATSPSERTVDATPPGDNKPPANTKPPTDVKPPTDTKPPTDIKSPTGPGVWRVELNANTKTVKPLVLNSACKTMVRIKITAKLGFAHLLSGDEIEIAPGGDTEISVEFDTTRTKPGVYKGELLFACLTCSDGDNCFGIRKRVPVNVHVKEGPVESTETKDRANPQGEQAQLFELLRQGKYKEAIAGFDQRAKENRANSRDYYGFAVAYEQLQDNERAAAYANNAFKFVGADQRMSKEERVDCERIAKLQAGDGTIEPDSKAEQAEVFELLRQGRYQEAVADSLKHKKEHPFDSRDYYGLALAQERLKEIGRARIAARRALADIKLGEGLDKKELADCERIANLPVASSDEQARLFELLRQRRYKEALPTFGERTKDFPGDSRDFYGLALTYEGLGEILSAKSAAWIALSSNKLSENLAKMELADCKRIAGLSPRNAVPAEKTEVHSVTLKPDTKATISTESQRSTCKTSHRLGVTLKDLPFVHLSSGNERIIRPEAEWSLLLEFDTAGMKAGNYEGQVLVSCLDCPNDTSCVPSWYKIIQINLKVTGEQPKLTN
jgi:hypothetical protein